VVFEQWMMEASKPGASSYNFILRTTLSTGVTETIAGPVDKESPRQVIGDSTLSTLCFRRGAPVIAAVPGAVPTDLWVLRPGDAAPVRVMLPVATNGVILPLTTFNASVSANGSALVFRVATAFTNHLAADGVWRMDLATATVTPISEPNDVNRSGSEDLTGPVVSADGQTVAYQTGLVDGSDSPIRLWSAARGLRTLAQWSDPAGKGFDPATATEPTLSADGKLLAYVSYEPHPDAGVPDGGTYHVYLRDLVTGVTRNISEVRDSDLVNVQFSDDGRWVSFESELPLGSRADQNNQVDVFLAPVSGGAIEPVTVADGALPVSQVSLGNHPSLFLATALPLSDDGNRIVFVTEADDVLAGDTNGRLDAVVRDRATGLNLPLGTLPDGSLLPEGSTAPVISGDGSHAAFQSSTRLLAAGDTNTAMKVFVRDLATGATVLASAPDGRDAGGGFASSNAQLSQDGKRVLFEYAGSDLAPKTVNGVNLFVRDIATRRTYAVTADPTGKAIWNNQVSSGSGRMSLDGSVVAFIGARTAYRYRIADQQLTPMTSPEFTSATYGMDLSGDGSRAAMWGRALGIAQPVLSWYDVDAASNHVLVRPFSSAPAPRRDVTTLAMSRNGNRLLYVGNFEPTGEILAGGVFGIWVYDIPSARFQRVGLNGAGQGSVGTVDSPTISADGRYVTFRGRGSDLAPGDDNGVGDVFVTDLDLGITTLLSRSPITGKSGNQLSSRPIISADGSRVAFQSFASDLTPGDFNGLEDVYAAAVPQWLRITKAVRIAGNQLEVHWWLPPGLQARLEWSASMNPGATWEPAPGDSAVGSDPVAVEVVRKVPMSTSTRFLRVWTL
jgi:Tol biopolymer transport system component